jgi:hypothetical protein
MNSVREGFVLFFSGATGLTANGRRKDAWKNK